MSDRGACQIVCWVSGVDETEATGLVDALSEVLAARLIEHRDDPDEWGTAVLAMRPRDFPDLSDEASIRALLNGYGRVALVAEDEPDDEAAT